MFQNFLELEWSLKARSRSGVGVWKMWLCSFISEL